MPIEEDFWSELAQIQAESIGWIPLEDVTCMWVLMSQSFRWWE